MLLCAADWAWAPAPWVPVEELAELAEVSDEVETLLMAAPDTVLDTPVSAPSGADCGMDEPFWAAMEAALGEAVGAATAIGAGGP